MHKTAFTELLYDCFTETLDIHCVTGSEMLDTAEKLCRTVRINAAYRRFIFTFLCRVTADRTYFRKSERSAAAVLCDTHDLRDYLARLAHRHRISDSYLKLVHYILIVERRTGNRCTGKHYRIEYRNRRKRACSADIYFDLPEDCLLFLRRVLESDRPLRDFRCGTEDIALGKVIDFNDSAVGIVSIAVFLLAYPAYALNSFIYRFADRMAYCVESKRREPVERIGMTAERFAFDLLDIENEDIEGAFRCYGAVLLAK